MSITARSTVFTVFLTLFATHLSGCFDVQERGRSPAEGRAASAGHPIYTRSADAQREFDRGLTLVYAFDYDTAIEAFMRAAELDPDASMAHWGIALALGPNLNDIGMEGRMSAAYAAAQRALTSAQDETDRERDYAAALARRYVPSPVGRLRERYVAYTEAMRQLVAKYPKDVDAAVLFAESLMLSGRSAMWSADGQPGDGTAEAIRVLEGALAQQPEHIGANHYYIHFLEGSATPERALAAARRIDGLSTGHGHLQHMPSHIYVRVGLYRAAVASNLKAVAVDGERIDAHGPVGGYQSLKAHAREFLSAAACLTGQFELARRTLTNFFVLMRFERWNDVLGSHAPGHPVAVLEWRVARVLAFLATGRLREAEVALKEYEQAEAALPKGARWWFDPIEKFLPLARSEMAARFAKARGDVNSAIRFWRNAVEAQDELTPGEVPPWPWFHPARESLGAELYVARQFVEAERVFREELERHPGNPRALFGLSSTLLSLSRDVEAADVRRQFDEAWADADAPLSMQGL